MQGFVIFALILTFGYMVYFAVMITLDLHGKKDEKKSEEETFDVSDMTNEEQPVAVRERSDDPDGGDMTYTEHITDDGLRVVNPTGNVVPMMPPLDSREPEDPPQQHSSTTSAKLNEANEEHMEPIEPNVQVSYLPDEFMQNLNEKHNKRKIEKKNARDKL